MRSCLESLPVLAFVALCGVTSVGLVRASDHSQNTSQHLIDNARIYDLQGFCSAIEALPARRRSPFTPVCRRLEHSENNVDVINLISETPAFQAMRPFEYLSGSGQGRIAVMAPGVAELVEGAHAAERSQLSTARSRRHSATRFNECEQTRTRLLAEYQNRRTPIDDQPFQEVVQHQALYLERFANQLNAAVGTLQNEIELIHEHSRDYIPSPSQSVARRVQLEIRAVQEQFVTTLLPIAQQVYATYLPSDPNRIWTVHYSITEDSEVALRGCTQVNSTDDDYRIFCSVYSYPMGMMFGTDVASSAAVADSFRDLEQSTWMTNIQTAEDYILSRMTGHQRRVCTRNPSNSVYLPRVIDDLGKKLIDSFEPALHPLDSAEPGSDTLGMAVESHEDSQAVDASTTSTSAPAPGAPGAEDHQPAATPRAPEVMPPADHPGSSEPTPEEIIQDTINTLDQLIAPPPPVAPPVEAPGPSEESL